jgi:hypothetical protein
MGDHPLEAGLPGVNPHGGSELPMVEKRRDRRSPRLRIHATEHITWWLVSWSVGLWLLTACNGAVTGGAAEPASGSESASESASASETESMPASAGPERESATEPNLGSAGEGSPPISPVAAPITAYGRLPAPTHDDLPTSAPSYAIHVPAGFDASRPYAIVVFLHGWSGCVRALVEPDEVPCLEGGRPRPGWALARVHDAAERNSVLVVPQLEWLARSGAPGAYRVEGTFESMLGAALEAAHVAGAPERLSPEAASSIVLAAHSAGFESALAILEAGDLADTIDRVLLMDSLYRGTDGFADWVAGAEERRIVSLYTGNQSTYRESQRLARLTRSSLGDDAVALRPEDVHAAMATHRVVVDSTRIPHGAIPRLSLPELLKAWQLPNRGGSN